MEKNPCIYATVPKYKAKKREIWTAETLMQATELCDEDRRKNAELFEEAFYGKQNLNPQMRGDEHNSGHTVAVPEGVDPEVLAKVLNNPEMMALLSSLIKTL